MCLHPDCECTSIEKAIICFENKCRFKKRSGRKYALTYSSYQQQTPPNLQLSFCHHYHSRETEQKTNAANLRLVHHSRTGESHHFLLKQLGVIALSSLRPICQHPRRIESQSEAVHPQLAATSTLRKANTTRFSSVTWQQHKIIRRIFQSRTVDQINKAKQKTTSSGKPVSSSPAEEIQHLPLCTKNINQIILRHYPKTCQAGCKTYYIYNPYAYSFGADGWNINIE